MLLPNCNYLEAPEQSGESDTETPKSKDPQQMLFESCVAKPNCIAWPKQKADEGKKTPSEEKKCKAAKQQDLCKENNLRQAVLTYYPPGGAGGATVVSLARTTGGERTCS